MTQVSQYQDIAAHPDIAGSRQRYEQVAASGPAVVIDGLVLLAGGWLAISPWVVGFSTHAPNVTVNNLILGAMIGVIALGLAVAPARMFRLTWSMVAIGVWLIVSPYVIQRSVSSAGIAWTNEITGGVTALLGLGAAALLVSADRRAAGGPPG
ncbi:SPW repeat protein [Dactylosporangium salmoneum]|uniref:SPW repeat protein n=1 Tax=Dactylosporangium salmoneum TaxID=53361 RepID=A0ABP5T3W6_9ACTN